MFLSLRNIEKYLLLIVISLDAYRTGLGRKLGM